MPTFNVKTTITLSAFFLAACVCSNPVEVEDLGPPRKHLDVEAISVISPGPPDSAVEGELHLTQSCPDYDVHIRGTITGLPPNSKHGFHIHEKGDLSDTTNPCVSTGGHYNPYQANHGAPNQPDTHRHAGDLGNIESNADGVAHINIKDHIVQLCGPITVIGRAFVIHEMVDDLGTDGGDSLVTGNAGKRLACGIIGIIEPDILEVPDNKGKQ